MSTKRIKKWKSFLFTAIIGALATHTVLHQIKSNAISKEKKEQQDFLRFQLYKACVEDAGHYIFRRVEGVESIVVPQIETVS